VCALNNSAELRKPLLLCYVTDRRALPGADSANSLESLTQKIEEIATAGIDWIQLREKDLPAAELAKLTRRTLHTKPANVSRVIVNDRLDVALVEAAVGVHLGERSLPIAEAKRLVDSFKEKGFVGQSFVLGASCHSLKSAQRAASDGADYLFFGPIFPTPSKAAFGAPQGLEKLAQVCDSVSIPVIAIGGITLNDAALCRRAGAAGIAAIRLFQAAVDLSVTFSRLRQV
jgi:thiamine-phosphate pyrophosphorylase